MTILIQAVTKNDLHALSCILSEIHTTSTSLNLGKSPSKKRKLDVNERVNGYTALHVAVANENHEAVILLLTKCTKLNVNIQDSESGYTALHKAFYLGNIKIALSIWNIKSNEIDVNIKDWEGNTCLDLLNSTMEYPRLSVPVSRQNSFTSYYEEEEDSFSSSFSPSSSNYNNLQEKTFVKKETSTSLWTWGTNSNYTLGHDDKNYPEIVSLTHKQGMSRACSIKTLKDFNLQIEQVAMSKYHTCILADGRVFVCGFGPGGRLGLGHEETTFSPTLVDGIKEKVVYVAIGPDHSVVITISGRVWTWGSNEYHQLGYATCPSHSNNSLNHVSNANTSTNNNTNNVNIKQECELIPKQVINGLKKSLVIGAAASKFHTAVFTDSGHVYTWGTNNGQLGYESLVQVTPRKITKFPQQNILQIAVTNTCTAILNECNEVYLFMDNEYSKLSIPWIQNSTNCGLKIYKKQPNDKTIVKLVSGHHQMAILTGSGDVYMWTIPSKEWSESWEQKNLQKPSRVWTAKKKFLKATDIAIGIDSSILISTESKDVYYGVISSPKMNKSNDVKLFKYKRIPLLQHIIKIGANSAGAFWAIRQDVCKGFDLNVSSTLSYDLKHILYSGMSKETHFCDFGIQIPNKPILWAHSSILAIRSPWVQELLIHKTNRKDSQMAFQVFSNHSILTIPHVSWKSVQLLLEYIYSGQFKKSWDMSIHVSDQSEYDEEGNPTNYKLYKDFTFLVHYFELNESDLLLYSGNSISREFQDSILSLFGNDFHADVVIYLKNEDIILAHQPILAARCPYFHALLSPDSLWTRKVDDKNKRIINLQHLDGNLFRILVLWMYGETDIMRLLKDISTPDLKSFIHTILELIAMSNELLMDSVKEICSFVLCNVMSIRNVFDLLDDALFYEAKDLTNASLDFGK